MGAAFQLGKILTISSLFFLFMIAPIQAQEGHGNGDHKNEEAKESGFDPVSMIMHHIADAHEWHLWDITGEDGKKKEVSIPLPVILYTEGNLDIFMSSAFDHGKSTVKKGDREYKLDHGHIEELNGLYVMDFSITKNVFSLFFSAFLTILIFVGVASNYKRGPSKPKGLASFMEPLILFVRDDIARPNISNNPEKYMPYLLTVFFFIWLNNLLGLVPFFPGGANLTGNISFTLVLAAFTLLITNLNGNKHYWKHTLMPPVPVALWPIMIPVEIIGIFTKPFALMIRLFANITAGHIIILSLVSLIFIFESVAVSPISAGFMLFMNCLELLVAALQAYIFTLLSALFIGMATEEAHH
ncbi:MAG: F0F1 ATP synthase subunit A [Chitinophagales bacterium]